MHRRIVLLRRDEPLLEGRQDPSLASWYLAQHLSPCEVVQVRDEQRVDMWRAARPIARLGSAIRIVRDRFHHRGGSVSRYAAAFVIVSSEDLLKSDQESGFGGAKRES